MYVCICNAVTERQIREAIESDGVRTLPQLQDALLVATCCGMCENRAIECLERSAQARPALALAMSA